MIVKSQACKLLEHMCDNVDGAATCIATFACNAINLALHTVANQPSEFLHPKGLWGMENDPFL
jgi:hypothetical protein